MLTTGECQPISRRSSEAFAVPCELGHKAPSRSLTEEIQRWTLLWPDPPSGNMTSHRSSADMLDTNFLATQEPVRMIPYQHVISFNERIRQTVPSGLVALFVGATSGIGQAVLQILGARLPNASVYVVGRSEAMFASDINRLRVLNPEAKIVFLEAQVSLLREVDRVCEQILTSEEKLDLLYMSPGYLGFGGPHYTEEGLDLCFFLSVYARARFVQRLQPLMAAAKQPRVLSILAGGRERALWTVNDDLDLRQDGGRHYTVLRAVAQVTTLHTLNLAYLASQNPHIAFIHVYPGLVDTGMHFVLLKSLGRGGGILAHAVDAVRKRFMAIPVERSGQWQAFHALTSRFPSREMIIAGRYDANDCAQCHVLHSGLYLVGAKGDSCANAGVLQSEVVRDWQRRSWQFVEDTIQQALQKRN
ncbi:Oxidoreductase lepF [Teratosphaeria destructans]|uniref:Oxidoreductase lepF n=1 Tax=Teratosphaeria destructans TaxID=418781 RepID=A0A9W7SZR9_9PEZI|nr:Oxidoreductase lepF [Teratosphaeria destructans]